MNYWRMGSQVAPLKTVQKVVSIMLYQFFYNGGCLGHNDSFRECHKLGGGQSGKGNQSYKSPINDGLNARFHFYL